MFMETLPQHQIQPEHLAIAQHYLATHRQDLVAKELGVDITLVNQVLNTPSVRRYIDSVFLELGYNNRYRLREALDLVIDEKFRELSESGLGSNKDIADLLQQSHKMTMDLLDREIKLKQMELDLEHRQTIGKQVNVQINDAVGQNYAQLLHKLLGGDGA